MCSVASRRNLATAFSAGGLVCFPQYQQNFIDLFYFAQFLPLLFSCIRFSFEQNTRKLIVYLRYLPNNNNFLFLFLIFRDIFWGPITFERYRFQSGCDSDVLNDTKKHIHFCNFVRMLLNVSQKLLNYCNYPKM